MKNFEVAAVFNEIADLLEIQNANPFRIRAYRKAAQNIESLTRDIEEIAKKDSLEDIPGIGKDLAGKIQEVVATGRLKYYENKRTEKKKSKSESFRDGSPPQIFRVQIQHPHLRTDH